jgi:hypothetical protein
MTVNSKEKVWTKLSKEEIRLAWMWYKDDKKTPRQIADLLHRDKSTMTRLLVQEVERQTDGRPPILDKQMVDKLVRTLEAMIRKAKGEWPVSTGMLRTRLRLKCCEKTILKALHSRKIWWHTMRQKPLLTDQDILDRHQFSLDFYRKPESWWTQEVDMVIDVKFFKIYLNREARKRAAKEGTWGVFRKKGQGLGQQYVRPNRRLKWNPGARGVHVLAGVGNGKVMLWQYMDGKRWCGKLAAEMYRGPITTALKNAHPGRRSFTILGDNDPSGFKTKAGFAAKAESHIKVFEIPKRSPQLNVCDYALWVQVQKMMRRQEKRFAPSFREARTAFMQRLRRTAMRLPSTFINASMKQMKKRCERLKAAEGGHFEEGGR